jgi:choline dehydrogenase-like flavoprotein
MRHIVIAKGRGVQSMSQPGHEQVTSVDVLVVGSGPVGAAYARIVLEAVPTATVLMVDRGPALTDVPGMNLKNLLKNGAMADLSAAELIPVVPPAALARSGTELIDPRGPRPGHMPAAAVSTNVGGMGAHWSCATPTPGDDERGSVVGESEWDELLRAAAGLLHSSTQAFGASARGAAMIELLASSFDGMLDRPVQVMPHACERLADGRLSWTGTDTVLGPLVAGTEHFTLRPDTLCRRLEVVAGRVVGAELVDVPTGREERVVARAVVVAGDSLRTPQLLWASGVRPVALGRYLNEHSMVGATVVLADKTMQRAAEIGPEVAAEDFASDPLAAVWLPYAGSTHRFSGQINTSPGSPAGFAVDGLDGVPASRIVSLTWFCPKQPREEDRIEFLEQLGADGMPIPDITYSLSVDDERVVGEAIDLTTQAGMAIGTFVAGEEPALLADGQSLHYMGTVRMGQVDDGTSVCDGYSRVWGVDGLYVGGNGVIPTATACNPTLTSVALAVRGARQLASELLG